MNSGSEFAVSNIIIVLKKGIVGTKLKQKAWQENNGIKSEK